MEGAGYPMVATHDPRLVDIAGVLAVRNRRPAGSYEYQMLYGVRPEEQRRLAAAGEKVRVYVPYGDEWYGYMMRRLAERPANVTFFLRSLVSKG
jgi:proline dehydrogenase